MTLLAVARFVASPSALSFAYSCKEFGVDPAAEIEDPFLASQLRLGLIDRMGREDEKQQEEEETRERTSMGVRRARIDSARDKLTKLGAGSSS